MTKVLLAVFSAAALLYALMTGPVLAAGSGIADARIERVNGAPTVVVNGEVLPPMSATILDRGTWTAERRKDYLRKLGASGIKIFYIRVTTRWNTPGDPKSGILDGVSTTIRDLAELFEAVPDAYAIIRLTVSPPADWVNSHPEEQVRFNDGKTRKVICSSVGKAPIDGMYSLCSEAWMRDADKAVREFFDEVSASPHFKRVIGTFLCSGGTSEWYYPQAIRNADRTYGDFSEPFRKFFESFLRRKYGDVETLRRVWKRPDATFEHPRIPNFEETTFIGDVDVEILKALNNWETLDRTIGLKIDMDGRKSANLGVFLNSNGYEHVADFFDAWHEGTARTIIHFARLLKDLYPTLLVGAFYGACGNTGYFDMGTATGTPVILDSGVVDFLAAPDVYNNREPGGALAQREMHDSIRLRNMMYICENDSRTHLTQPWVQRDAMALYTAEDSVNTLKRDFARNLCEDVRGWWFDMGPGWYDDKNVLALFKRQQEIFREAYARDRTKKNEIALIYDTESLHHVSQAASQLVVDFYRTSDLHRIGAPADFYFHNDMARPDMPDYKLYVMLNQFYLTDAEREAVHAKARRNGATVLWLYAPGFINPDAATVMSVENIAKTVGMKVGMIDKTFFPHFRVDPASHPAVAGASATRRYGVIDRDVHSCVWISTSVLRPPYANPGFYADDAGAAVLGRYCGNGLPAMALVKKGGFTSVFCGAPVLRSDMLASIAEYAGCHLYLRSDDVLFANENHVAVHASSDGVKRVHFKRPCTPVEVYEGRAYGENVTHLDVEMKLGETKMWRIR